VEKPIKAREEALQATPQRQRKPGASSTRGTVKSAWSDIRCGLPRAQSQHQAEGASTKLMHSPALKTRFESLSKKSCTILPICYAYHSMKQAVFLQIPTDVSRRQVTRLALAAPLLTALWLAGCAGSTLRRGPMSGTRNPPPSSTPLDLAPDAREAVVAQALLLVNTPYRYGGNTPEGGFDCSGLVSYVLAQAAPTAARRLPRSTAQWAAVTVPVDQPQRGDLVFFNTGAPFSHMGIYVGNGQFVHAPSSGGEVRKDSLQSRYFAAHYEGTRRVFAAEP
jgi:cell wall-associated NlpC family hydrolase